MNDNTLIYLLLINAITLIYVNADYIYRHKLQKKKIVYKYFHYLVYINAFLCLFSCVYLILSK